MKDDDQRMEGHPSMLAALAVGILGFILLGGLALLVFLMPKSLTLGHWIGGGLLSAFAVWVLPYQVLDARSRKYILGADSLIYKHGVLSRSEVEIPFTSIQAVSIRQGILQRVFGCGDVRIAGHGVSSGILLSSRDLNSITISSIHDFEKVRDIIRAGMRH